ncbi:MAG: tetratricopeptide repeat protein [Syntrophaceae bacterium]|nr:tetratricopeptide repeat protein [Syntrophaceae bacterium]
MGKAKRGQKQDDIKVGSKPPEKEPSSFLNHLIAVLLIVGVAWAAYSNTFHVPFQFDDPSNITQNPNIQIRAFTWDRLGQLIRNTYKETIRIFSYFTLALNFYVGGFDVFGYHLVNFFIHIASGIFLYWFLFLTLNLPSLKRRYGAISVKVSLFTALIFISHPIQTQSVTYIVQRMASMAGMFYLLCFVLYIKARGSSGKSRVIYFVGLVISYLLGVFTKENVAILPLFIALYEFYFFQNFDLGFKGRKILLGLIATLLVIGGFGFLLWGGRYIDVIIEGYKDRPFTMSERVLTQFRVVLYYLTLLAYPHPSRLNLDYDFPVSKSLLDPFSTLISILFTAGLLGYSIWIAKRRPILSFSILWYFGNLVIESSIFPLEMVFEHRLYLPAVGPFLLFSLLVVNGIERWRERMGVEEKPASQITLFKKIRSSLAEIVIFGLVILLLTAGAFYRNRLWNSPVDLWADCVKKSPNKSRPYVNLGLAYFESGQYGKALETTQKAIDIDPKSANAYYNLGMVLQKMGDLNKAIGAIRKSLDIDPTFNMAHYTLGMFYFEKGQYEESAEAFHKFVKAFPYFPEVHHLLGVVYAAQKKFDQSVAEFEWELRVNPYHALAHLNLGQIYWFEFRNREKALYHLKAALSLAPFLPNRAEVRRLVHLLEGLSWSPP